MPQAIPPSVATPALAVEQPSVSPVATEASPAKLLTDEELKSFYKRLEIPMPRDLHVVQPDNDIPKEVREFSGAHVGYFSGGSGTYTAVFERFLPDGSAIVVYGKTLTPRAPARTSRLKFKFENGRFRYADNAVTIEFWFEEGRLKGSYHAPTREWDVRYFGEFSRVQ